MKFKDVIKGIFGIFFLGALGDGAIAVNGEIFLGEHTADVIEAFTIAF